MEQNRNYKKLKHSLKDYYDSHRLSSEQINSLQQIREKFESSEKQPRILKLPLFLIPVLSALLVLNIYFFNDDGNSSSSNLEPVLSNATLLHLKDIHMMDINFSDSNSLQRSFPQLDFQARMPGRFNDQSVWKVLGANYFTFDNQLGIFIKLIHKSTGEVYTLCTVKDNLVDKYVKLRNNSYVTIKDGLNVQVWKENGLAYVLTGSPSKSSFLQNR